MIVEGHDERGGMMSRLQIRIGLVLGVAPAIIVEAVDFVACVGAIDGPAGRVRDDDAAMAPILIDIVAIMEDRVEVRLLAQMAIGAVPALGVGLTTGEPEPNPIRQRADGRRRSGHAHWTCFGAFDEEAIPIGSPWSQPVDFDMDTMRQFRARQRVARPDDTCKMFILRHFPADWNGQHGHAPMHIQRHRCETGPDHEAVRPGIPCRDAEREGV